MSLSLIVAMSENGVIGRDGQMPWRLSDDLKRFKKLTMGHHMIMGRKTFDSIGRLLPGRATIILTRDKDWSFPGALIAYDLDSAIEMASDDNEIYIVGGGEIYRQAMPRVTRMYVTRVHCTVDDGDTSFPEIVWDEFQQGESTRYPSNAKNDFDSTYTVYERKT